MTLSVYESEFQSKVERAIGGRETHGDYRVWRHFVGQLWTKQGHPIRVGITGSCDLTGIARRSGRRIEIEMKSEEGERSPEQINWGERMTEYGAIYLVPKYDPSVDMKTNVGRVLAELREKDR